MTGAITQNFRGLRALVIHPDDANRATLAAVLGKLGLVVTLRDACDGTDAACDVMFVDADGGIDGGPEGTGPAVPCIALVGTEAPSRLARVVRRNCASHILKPIRNTGVYTALLLAMNEHERRLGVARETEALRQRLAGRRVVTEAVLDLMKVHGVGQDAAYEMLRVAAMNRRLPLHELARERLSGDAGPPAPVSRDDGSTRNPDLRRRRTP